MKRLQNVRRRARFAIKNPRYALNALVRKFNRADDRLLARLIGSSPRQIRKYLDEPVNTPAFGAHLQTEEQHFVPIESANLFAKKILNQYAAVRAIAPDCIVETSVASGVPSFLSTPRLTEGRTRSSALYRPCRHGVPSPGEKSRLACSSLVTRCLAGSFG